MILALCSDLIFSTKITSTADTLDVDLQVLRSIETLEVALGEDQVSLVLIDLDIDGVDPIEAIRTCRKHNSPVRTVGFVSHVHADLIEAAQQAGADEVMARSAFSFRLPAIIGERNDSTS